MSFIFPVYLWIWSFDSVHHQHFKCTIQTCIMAFKSQFLNCVFYLMYHFWRTSYIFCQNISKEQEVYFVTSLVIISNRYRNDFPCSSYEPIYTQVNSYREFHALVAYCICGNHFSINIVKKKILFTILISQRKLIGHLLRNRSEMKCWVCVTKKVNWNNL